MEKLELRGVFELVYTRGKRERKKKEIALLSKTWKRKEKEEFRHPNVPKGERERGEICYKAVPGMFSLRCHRHHHHRSSCRVRTYVTNISFFFQEQHSRFRCHTCPITHSSPGAHPTPPSLSPTGKKILPKVRYYILFLLDELKQPSLFLHSRT